MSRTYMRALAATCLVLSLAGFAGVSQTDYLSAKRKFQTIDKQPPKPGTRVTLTSAEINAYVQTELPKVAPAGIREPASNCSAAILLPDERSLTSSNSVPDRGSQPIG